ncbi:MAG TPA: FtsX-like permease family protein [Sphingomonas sp.]|nr:FtsX-like permease family protein [Sphingomonas sp.]
MLRASLADRRLLPEGRLAGPMPWVIAIMMFLTALALAGGLAMGGAAARLGQDLGRQITLQIVVADPARREQEANAALRLLGRQDGVIAVHRLAEAEMQALLRPWLGNAGLDHDLPLPAMIDLDLDAGGRARFGSIAKAVTAVAPHARLDDHASWLSPLVGLIRSLGLLAGGIVALMVGATAAAVVLAARSALNTHRQTIDVMHMMGATDVQVARLFQRRLALDALFGATLGLVSAVAVILLIGRRIAEIGSGLVGSIELPSTAWAALLTLPLVAGLLALAVARITVQRALGRTL